MTKKPRILAFAGSTRNESYNKKLLKLAATGAEKNGAEVTIIDLKDFLLPLYDADLEENNGIPEAARKLKELMKSHDAFLIASPEYNSSVSGVLKNAIDWASRPQEGEKILACFKNKTAAILSASPGRLGGIRGLAQIRALLENLFVMVIPDQLAVKYAHNIFNDDETINDPELAEQAALIGKNLAIITGKLIN